jgi:MoxR-like ATPase
MKPSLLLQEILNCWNADLIPMLIGSPGGGKSDLVRQAAKKRAELMGLDFDDNVDTYIDNHASPEKIFGYIDFRTTSRDPIDMSGGLDMSGEFTRYKSPGYLPHAKVHGKVGTIMFDEANRAAPSMQNCLIEVFLDRKVGG